MPKVQRDGYKGLPLHSKLLRTPLSPLADCPYPGQTPSGRLACFPCVNSAGVWQKLGQSNIIIPRHLSRTRLAKQHFIQSFQKDGVLIDGAGTPVTKPGLEQPGVAEEHVPQLPSAVSHPKTSVHPQNCSMTYHLDTKITIPQKHR